MRIIHFLSHDDVLECEGKYYICRPFFVNELSKHFKIKLYVVLNHVSFIDKSKYNLISESIDIIDFFKDSRLIGFLNNYFYYNNIIRKLKRENSSDLFMIFYPVKSIDVLLCKLLNGVRVIVWVKSNPSEYLLSSLRLNVLLNYLYYILKPILNLFYIIFSKLLLKNKLVFHTGEVTIKTTKGKYFAFISSSIQANDIVERDNSFDNKIIYVGNMMKQKGITFLIKAMNKLNNHILTIVGGGVHEMKIRKSVKGLNNVVFYGPEYNRKKLFELIRSHDILVLPSLSEKQGKVQLEAMSQGTVVIATDVGGVKAVVKDGVNGLLIKPASSKAIVKAVRKLYNDRELYLRLQKNGYETAKKFTLKNQVIYMKSIIDREFLE